MCVSVGAGHETRKGLTREEKQILGRVINKTHVMTGKEDYHERREQLHRETR